MKKISIFLAAILLIGTVSGCGAQKKENATITVEETYPWNEEGVTDSSDVPDWTGDKIELTWWQGHGTSADTYQKMENDVVTPEVERVTGVSFNNNDRIDNGGQSFDVKLSMLLASKDFPNVVMNPASVNKLIEADVIYDVKPYIEKYCPNIMKKYPQSVFQEIYDLNKGDSSTMYALPVSVGGDYLDSLEDFDLSRISRVGAENYEYVYVRDDILKKIYPQAKTQDEIEKMYLENGKFTLEDIFDVPINSYDDFLEFLSKIRKLDIKEDGKTVYPTYAFTGSDNWPVMQCMWYGLEGMGSSTNYMFTYWDRKDQKIQLALTQDFFKDSLTKWNKMVIDDIVSPDSLIDTNDTFKEKLNNGLYAVTSNMNIPDEGALKAAGKNYRYRKVYLNIPMNTEKFVPLRQANFGCSAISVFKTTTSEAELIQFLRYIDFCVSDIGEKLMSWGPRSAGLWEEKDGKRHFTDSDVENYVVYGEENNAKQYNLINITGTIPTGQCMIPQFAYGNMSKFHPAYVYDRKRSAKDANNAFSVGSVEKAEMAYAVMPNIWAFTDRSENAKKAWGNRVNVENALTKILASANDDDFAKNYNEMLDVLKQSGWTNELLDDMNTLYKEMNAEYMDNLK